MHYQNWIENRSGSANQFSILKSFECRTLRTFLEELKTNERPQLACPDKAGKEWPFARHLHLHESINVPPDSSDQILSDHDLYVESSFSMRREIPTGRYSVRLFLLKKRRYQTAIILRSIYVPNITQYREPLKALRYKYYNRTKQFIIGIYKNSWVISWILSFLRKRTETLMMAI